MIQWARHFLCTLASVSPPGVIPEQTEPEVKPSAHLCVAKKQVKNVFDENEKSSCLQEHQGRKN